MAHRPDIQAGRGFKTDLDYYRERAVLIIDGPILYTLDFDVECPPLILYLMVPPQISGGADWMYQLYFSLFVILTSVCIYRVLHRKYDREGFELGLQYIFIPFLFSACRDYLTLR
jgi:hypothetical protein